MLNISCNAFEIELPTTKRKPLPLFLYLLIKILRVFESYAIHLTQQLAFQGSICYLLPSLNKYFYISELSLTFI